jgi:arabinofuranosyltransferase
VTRRTGRAAQTIIAACFCAWSAAFIYRTSVFAIDGRRYFSLFDDAMISMRYAWNLSHGAGLVWNAGERVQGYTNLLMTLVMSVATTVFDRSAAVLSIQVLGVLLLLAIAWITARIASALPGAVAAPQHTTVTTLAFFCALAYYPLTYWTLSGMETGLLALLVLSAVLASFTYTTSHALKHLLWVGVLLGLAVLTRMDAAIAAVLIWTYVAWESARGRSRQTIGHLTASFAIFILFVAGQLLFQLWYYGDALPNTYTLKLTGMPLGLRLRDGWGFIAPFLKETMIVWVLAAAGLALNFQPRSLLLFAIAVSSVAYEIYVGGDPWNYWRLMAPSMPLAFVLVISAIDRLSAVGRVHRNALAAGCTIAVVLSANVRFLPEIGLVRRPYLTAKNAEDINTALVLDELTTREASVGVVLAGSIPYYLDRTAIDFLGKSDRYIARLPPDTSGRVSWSGMHSVPGHNKYDLEYSIKRLDPTFVQVDRWGGQDLAGWVAAAYVSVECHGVRLWLRRGSTAVRWRAQCLGGDRVNRASRTTMPSVAASTTSAVVSKLLARIEKTSRSPSAVVTYPDSARTFDIDPLFARALPSAAVPFMRLESVPSLPATGSEASNGVRSAASPSTCIRIATSVSGET